MTETERKELLKKIEEAVASSTDLNYSGEYWGRTSCTLWEKGGKSRLYLNHKYGRYYRGRSKWTRSASAYLDLVEGRVVVAKDGNSAERGHLRDVLEGVEK